MSTLLAAAMLAIVTQNQVALRAAPRESAPQQATLWQGEVLDLRDARGDYLLVYDPRIERQGYLRASQVRLTALTPAEAPELLAVVRFLRDTPGAEALGISYAAAYLKAVPVAAMTAEPFDALGVMADRLAMRASTIQARSAQTIISAHLEVVAGLGVRMRSFDHDGSVQICYDGDLFHRVLAMPSADPAELARAALGLTRHECVDPNLGPTERFEFDQWRADVLDRVPLEGLNPGLKSRVLMRRAGVLSSVAYWRARRGLSAQLAGERSIEDLAGVDKTVLDEEGLRDYFDAAVRVGATRLAALPLTMAHAGRLQVRTSVGGPGETCVSLVDSSKPIDGGKSGELVRRCTYGMVWTASASANVEGTALALAVQPLPTWRELWVFRLTPHGWTIDTLPPDSDGLGLGYIEAAGWDRASHRLLVCRESRVNERLQRRFELLSLTTLVAVHHASRPDYLLSFARWQDPVWSSNTVALR
jgi:hypothetical protein